MGKKQEELDDLTKNLCLVVGNTTKESNPLLKLGGKTLTIGTL